LRASTTSVRPLITRFHTHTELKTKTALALAAAAPRPAQASRPLPPQRSSSSSSGSRSRGSSAARRRLSTAANTADEQQQQQHEQPEPAPTAATAADPAAGIPHTHRVYVEYTVAHGPGYMSERLPQPQQPGDSRADRLLRLVREAGRVAPGVRVSAAAVDGGPAPVTGATDADADAGTHQQQQTLTYGAVVFNDEDGAAEREVAALAEEGALERVAAAARSFGVTVSALGARVGSRRLR